jgi:AI-2 transport protein TqsA
MNIPHWFLGLVTATIVLAILVVGRSFLIPIAVALVLFNLLTSLINHVTRVRIGGWSVPRPIAIAVGLIVVVYLPFLIASVFSAQVEAVVAASPRYFGRVESLVAAAAEYLGHDLADDLRKGLTEINLGARIPAVLGSAGSIITSITLIALYVAFLFVERGAFHAKFERLFPDPERAEKMRTVLGSIARSVQRYFFIKLVVSVMTGAAAYAVMRPVGLDFAETWAILAVFLNFIPNIGSVVATIFPAAVALVQFDTRGPFFVIVIGMIAIQFVIGSFVEPPLMGRSLNLSPLVIILSLTFWAFVWGIVGMFLSVPIMVMVLIVCSHVPAWRPVAVILSRNGQIPDSETTARGREVRGRRSNAQ